MSEIEERFCARCGQSENQHQWAKTEYVAATNETPESWTRTITNNKSYDAQCEGWQEPS